MIRSLLFFFALGSTVFPTVGVHAASTRSSVAIKVSVSPVTSVRDGTTITVTASTSRPVSNIWLFDGSVLDIVNVLYVASCDASPKGSFTRCSGHARYARGIIHLPDPPYFQSKATGATQTFFACWDSIAAANCSKAVTVTWKKTAPKKHHHIVAVS